MKKTIWIMAAGVALLSTSKIAMAVDIGGLNVPDGPTFSVGQIYENVPTAVGDTLSGYGKVDSINSIAIGSLCTDCELTFQFGGYTVSSISPTEVKFTGGFINFYLGFGANNDFSTANAGGSAGDLVEATNGTLFLTLKGHDIDAAGNTFVAIGAGIGSSVPTGFESGLLDVDTSGGGIANSFFDTNSIPALFGGGNADLQLGASLSGLNPVYPGEGPGGPAAVRGSVDTTATTVVPEPQIYALILAGLGLLPFVMGRRKL
jgi:hypothetical protein